MTPGILELPPNGISRFYRGGPAIAALRGYQFGDRVPEEWIASTTTVFGEDELGLSRLADGQLLRDVIAADPEAWLGPEHVARFGADPALLVKLLDAGERLPVHSHPNGPFARKHLGTRFGKTEAWIVVAAQPGAQLHLGFREPVSEQRLRDFVAEQDTEAMLAALNPIDVQAGDAVFVPAGVPHGIGEGLLIVELQEPSDMSVLVEWHGFADDEDEATLGMGWDTALQSVDRDAIDAAKLRGQRPDGAIGELLPPEASAFFTAQRVAPAGDAVRLEPGFAVAVVLDGSGRIGELEVERGATVVIPNAVGPVNAEGELTAIVCRPPAVEAPTR